MDILQKIAKELGVTLDQVEGAVKLLDEGATVPFIARYRKEATGSMDDQVLRVLAERLVYLRSLEERKSDILRILEEQGTLTDDLRKEIVLSETQTRLEDIYLPFRPRKRTRATIAREKGMEPLCDHILSGGPNPRKKAETFLGEGVETVDDAIAYAMDIIAERVSEDPAVRGSLRAMMVRTAFIVTEGSKANTPYEAYYKYREEARRMPGHRILAINRGEKEGILKVSVEADEEAPMNYLKGRFFTKDQENDRIIESALKDAFKRLIFPSLERELRNTLTERAEDGAIHVFKENLKSVLMQPPVKGMRVIGFDPGFRTGCKFAVLDETGKYLDGGTVYPTVPRQDIDGTIRKLKEQVKKHNVSVISLGNGTASRESELVMIQLIEELKKEGTALSYVITNEAGASVYSASELASREYPELDVTIRGAISIARRLQDPMVELVKIDPKSIGVGQYQHDITRKKLDDSLTGVVEDCVNTVGVDINMATPSLLEYVSGINKTIAKNIVDYRDETGGFRSRSDLRKVKRLGDKAFEQCAGFLRIREGREPLDNTAVHPEAYQATKTILKELGFQTKSLSADGLKDIERIAEDFGMEKLMALTALGAFTIRDILKELAKPGRDPREALPLPIFRQGVMEMKDLEEGMVLTGTVRNVSDFGAFVDIGVHQDGLVHKSQMADRFVTNPLDIVKSGEVVEVRVLSVDLQRKRISLSMKGMNRK